MSKVADFVLEKLLAFLKSGLGAKVLARLLKRIFNALTGKDICPLDPPSNE